MIEKEQQQYNALRAKFLEYYNTKLLPLLEQKEQFREKCLKEFWYYIGIVVLLSPLLLYGYTWGLRHYQEDTVFQISFGIGCLIFLFVRLPYAKYRKQIKNDIMGEFIKFFEDFSYKYGEKMREELIKKSLIFPKYDEIEADDCFFGKYQDVNIKIYEQKLNEVRRGSKGQKYRHTVFQGVAVEMDMNKNFCGQTIVVKDEGIFNRLRGYDNMERINLEDIVFEKEFEVYGTNQVEARYLLTTAFMERILRLKALFNGKTIQISFYANKILLAIDTQEDMFEACSFFKTNINQAKFEHVFEEIWTLFSIINILKLNQHIGM